MVWHLLFNAILHWLSSWLLSVSIFWFCIRITILQKNKLYTQRQRLFSGTWKNVSWQKSHLKRTLTIWYHSMMILSCCVYMIMRLKKCWLQCDCMCITTQISHISKVYDSERHFSRIFFIPFLFYFPQDFLTPTPTAPRTNRNENTPMCLSNVY